MNAIHKLVHDYTLALGETGCSRIQPTLQAILTHVATLTAERDAARKVVADTLWMAGRYADGRRTYAPSLYNDALAVAVAGGFSGNAQSATDGDAPEYVDRLDVIAERDAALAELARLRGERQWRPISSAPKDGTQILVFGPKLDGGHYIDACAWPLSWTGEHWPVFYMAYADGDPTHWLPLPEAPNQTGSAEVGGGA